MTSLHGYLWTWATLVHLTHSGWTQFSDNTPPVMWLDRTWDIPDTEAPGVIVARVRADDSEKDPLEFGLERHFGFNGPSQDTKPLPFRIDNVTGVVYLNDTVKDMGGQRFLLYVTVSDGKLTAKNEVLVNILDSKSNSTSASHKPPKPPGFPGAGFPGAGFPGGSGGRLRPPGFILPPSQPGFNRRPPRPTTTSSTSTEVTGSTEEEEAPSSSPRSSTTSTDASSTTPSNTTPPVKGDVVTMNDLAITIIPIVAVCGLFVVGGIVAWLFRRRLCRQRGKKTKDDMRKESSGGIVLEDPMVMQQWRGPRAHSNRYEAWERDHTQTTPAGAPVKPHGDHWEFPRHRLKVFNILGEGCFGQVWRCEAFDIDGKEGASVVAVKTLKENAAERERTDLVQELQVMKMLEPHPNVVRLLGCCTEKEPLFVIMEFVPHGKLQSFLRSSRAERHYGNLHGPSKTLTSRDLTSFVYQVARGMQFLSGKGIIHRDLAARNVLVGEGHVCKVADFGFARDVITSHVYERKSEGRLPIRWMAPESLYDNVFSVASDVWSFGVLIWEIVTLGSTPYPGLAASDVMKKVRDGYRLDKPEHCRRELYNIMYYCWDKDPKERPNFGELTTMLEQLLLTETEYIELERFPDHSYYNMVSLSGEKL